MGSTPSKRWCAKATLGANGCYTASGPTPVGDTTLILGNLRAEVGKCGAAFAGFDFPIGIPVHFAERAGVTRFRDFLPKLGKGDWSEFHSVCDAPEQISVFRPFYPNGGYKGRLMQDLLRGHGVSSLEPLLRLCERADHGYSEASCLFWTLGGKQVGKAALVGWKDVLAKAVQEDSIRIWPFDGNIESLLQSERIVVTETYPAEFYRWFAGTRPQSKMDIESRKRFGSDLLEWARRSEVFITPELEDAIDSGFPKGKDDAFDAVVGLFGILQICLGERRVYEPDDRNRRSSEAGASASRTTKPS